MTARTYPYNAWVLTPRFKPVERHFIGKYETCLSIDFGDYTSEGKMYQLHDIFPSKVAAIKEGIDRLNKQQAELDKRQQNILKRHAALDKASKEV